MGIWATNIGIMLAKVLSWEVKIGIELEKVWI